MENQKQHFPHILFYYFRKGKNAVQAHKKLSDVYGEDALKLRQCQNSFTKFRSRDFNVKDAPRSGRPIEIHDDKMKALIDSNRRLTTREITENLNISKSSVENHSKRLGYISKLDIWVPHELKEIHLTKRIDICDSLSKRPVRGTARGIPEGHVLARMRSGRLSVQFAW
ncbi:Histone-lysine N-methyltransferase SETMAR [Ooceraea biroi]|uniref:Histone-lysine N-methyltransferase SETMAR n=1 Tax=Ooceraea biroi TaxID=2015173 RepID=A0A026VTB1_OOCBI|nr:Histone-lysine N-methyltransferase SETMAR [Ooceraea biroi]